MPRRRPPSGTACSPTSRRAACRRATRTGPTAWPGIPPRSRSSTSSRPRSGSPTSCSAPRGSWARRCAAYDAVPRLAPRALARRAGHRPHARDADQRGRALRAARARARRHRGAARAARGRGIRRTLPLPRPLQLPVQRASAARPRRRPERGGARLRGARAGAGAGSPPRGRLARRHRPQPARRAAPRRRRVARCAGLARARRPPRAPAARRPRSRQPIRPASSRATSTTGWPRSPPRRPPTPPSSSSTPPCSCTSTSRAVRGSPTSCAACPGTGSRSRRRAVTPGIRVRDDVENDSSDLVLALDGVQLAWAQPHGRAIRWVPNP